MVFCRPCGTYSTEDATQCPKCHAELSTHGEVSLTNSRPLQDNRWERRIPSPILAVGAALFPATLTIVVLLEENGWNISSIWDALLVLSFFVTAIAVLIAISRRSRLIAGTLAVLVLATVFLPARRGCHGCVAPESAAVSNLRTINTAEVTYLSSSEGKYGSVPELITSGLIDERFAKVVSGYQFQVTVSGEDYTATAMPTTKDAGRFGYFSTPDAVIRYATAVTATCIPCFPADQSGAPVQ